jgi:hypothetical protein
MTFAQSTLVHSAARLAAIMVAATAQTDGFEDLANSPIGKVPMICHIDATGDD